MMTNAIDQVGRARHASPSKPVTASTSTLQRYLVFAIIVLSLWPQLDVLSYAQSTFGEVLGSVHDPSGNLVVGADVSLVNTGTGEVRIAKTDEAGLYQFVNTAVGNYVLRVQQTGFKNVVFSPFDVTARLTVRLDVTMRVAADTTTITVESTHDIETDVSNLSETKGSEQLNDIPVAIYSRSTGSTSAYWTLTAQPGVQTDSGGNIAVAGAPPSQIGVTVDGISTVGPTVQGALQEMFPSFNAIEEMKISESTNSAEFGGVADITTVTKSGTNQFHGGAFENLQNTVFNASNWFAQTVQEDKMNDFGLFFGGPVVLPKLYNGHDKTFFFASAEILRLPKTSPEVFSVPTPDMLNGDLSVYLDPSLGGSANQLTGYPNNQIPSSQINPFSIKLDKFLVPLPNYGGVGAIANNYVGSFPTPINSAQTDLRVDQILTSKQHVYGRYSYKNKRTSSLPTAPLLGPVVNPEIDQSLTLSHNWVITPSLVNEVRAGMSMIRRDTGEGFTAQQAADALGLEVGPGKLPNPLPNKNAYPGLSINGFGSYLGPLYGFTPQEDTQQVNDNLTWTKGRHTMKFGADIRRLATFNAYEFDDESEGNFGFDGVNTAFLLGGGAAVPFAAFLLGYPDNTDIAGIINNNTNARSYQSGFFGQDDFRISRALTLNFGLRYEYHPEMRDPKNGNLSNFDPYYASVINGQTVQGAVILPNKKSFTYLDPYFASSIAPIPVILASTAGVPESLSITSKTDFLPRFGFAWRVNGSEKTVIRGGYGLYVEGWLGGSVIAGYALSSLDNANFANYEGPNGLPVYSMPYSYPTDFTDPGSVVFDDSFEIKAKDPKVEQWNLTVERDLGKGVGLRVSYVGNHSYHMPLRTLGKEVPPNTLGWNSPTIQAEIPFKGFYGIYEALNPIGMGHYNSAVVSAKKQGKNIQFETSYIFQRDLSDTAGAFNGGATGFETEFGVFVTSNFHPRWDYGNVSFDRRHRFLTTFLYQLPFGKGKDYLNNNTPLDWVAGGWEMAGIVLSESGPFMSTLCTSDPTGEGLYQQFGVGGPADVVPGVSPYKGRSVAQWINPAAFVNPPNNVARIGTSAEGSLVGPGVNATGLSMLKRFPIKEQLGFQFGAQVSNLFNHPNFLPPSNLIVGIPAGFGQLSAINYEEGAGPRQMEFTFRFSF